jgi:hypothetical protein
MIYLLLLFYFIPTVVLYYFSVKNLDYEEIDWRHVGAVFIPFINLIALTVLLMLIIEDLINLENLPQKIFLKRKKK